MKKTSVLTIMLAIVFLVTACTPTTPSTPSEATGQVPPEATQPSAQESIEAPPPEEETGPVVLTVAYPSDPQSFCGILNFWTMSAQIDVQIFNRILGYDPNYNLVGDLAESWEVSPDGKTHTFKLVPNVKWHDGQPFTSADVKFHFELLMEKGTGPTISYFKNLESIETPDETTVVFHFSEFTSSHIFARIHADAMILPKHIYETGELESNPANFNPIGTGPFKFVEYVQDSHIILEANPDYFKGRPTIDQLIYRIIPQPSAALLALEAGEVDTIDESLGIPPSELERLRNNPEMEVDAFPYFTVLTLAFNGRDEALAKHPWLANRQVRIAIAHAIDREFLVNTVLNNVTTLQDTALSNTIKWAYNPDTFQVDYNPAEAERILDEEGWPRKQDGTRFSFEMPVHIFAGADLVAEALQQMFREVGIAMTVTPIEITAFVDEYHRGERGLQDFAMTVRSGGTGPDPQELRGHYYSTSTTGWANNTAYSNQRVDELLDMARVTVDQGVVAEYYKELQAIVNEDFWILPLYNNYRIEAWNNKFTGFRETHRPLAWFSTYEHITLVGEE